MPGRPADPACLPPNPTGALHGLHACMHSAVRQALELHTPQMHTRMQPPHNPQPLAHSPPAARSAAPRSAPAGAPGSRRHPRSRLPVGRQQAPEPCCRRASRRAGRQEGRQPGRKAGRSATNGTHGGGGKRQPGAVEPARQGCVKSPTTNPAEPALRQHTPPGAGAPPPRGCHAAAAAGGDSPRHFQRAVAGEAKELAELNRLPQQQHPLAGAAHQAQHLPQERGRRTADCGGIKRRQYSSGVLGQARQNAAAERPCKRRLVTHPPERPPQTSTAGPQTAAAVLLQAAGR